MKDFDVYQSRYEALPFERILEKFREKRVKEIVSRLRLANGNYILEVGPGPNPIFPIEGLSLSVDFIEPIEKFVKKLERDPRLKIPKIRIMRGTLEENLPFSFENKYDLVILSSVLHEFVNPSENLMGIYKAMKPGGKLLVVVPNNQSVHRLIGLAAEITKSFDQLTSTEMLMSQTISFSLETLENFLVGHGFRIIENFSSFLKILPHAKMAELCEAGIITNKELDFFYEISMHIPGYCAEIFTVVEK
jgi:SAM-dependent methyltransferase